MVPYRAQSHVGQADFTARSGVYSGVRVRTINKFHGAETDVVVYTMVATRSNGYSFAIDPKRVLVALTRTGNKQAYGAEY